MRAAIASSRRLPLPIVLLVSLACAPVGTSSGTTVETRAPVQEQVRGGDVVFGSWRSDAPGVRHRIRPSDLPAPVMRNADAEASSANPATVVPRPSNAALRVPDGFTVRVFASGFRQPRRLRIAPNGDIFLSESGTGRVLVFRAQDANAASPTAYVFAENLDRPYGIAFVPPANPRYVYVAAANEVVRYPYRNGALRAEGPAETIIPNLPTKRHWTRDLAVSRDGSRLFLAVGSASNLGVDGMGRMSQEKIRAFEATHGRGSAWGEEEDRAVVRVFDPAGDTIRNYATGIRNCSGLTMQPGTDNVWCVVNERDHLGPDMVPDYMARIQDGAFYGWPWYTIGTREDPARPGERPDLRDEVRVPEVLFQAHSSALDVTFVDHGAFPADWRGDALVAMHGSHSRPELTGYKVVRVHMNNGVPTGEYSDFMTGFVLDNRTVWGRPASVAVTRDGGLLIADDANGTIFRVTRR